MAVFAEACRQRNSHFFDTLTSDADGRVSGTVEYDVFGKVVTETGVFVSSYGGMTNLVFGYAGKPYDPVTGLSDYGFRDYAPSLARFTTVDPIRDGSNWYAYCNSDPVNYVDMWGLDPWDLYTSIRDARDDFGKKYNDDSINNGVEYGTTIYKTKQGSNTYYYYSTPNIGDSDSVWLLTKPINIDDEISEFTHTHGDTSGDPEHLSDNGDGSDKDTSRKYGIQISAFAPSGNCYIFDPKTGKNITYNNPLIPSVSYDSNGNIIKPQFNRESDFTPIGTDPNNEIIPDYIKDKLERNKTNKKSNSVYPSARKESQHQSSSNCNNN